MRMQLLRACVLLAVAGAAVAADKPKKDKPTTTPPAADVGKGGLGNLGVKAALADPTFTISKPVGTWVRDVKMGEAACRFTLEIADNRLALKIDAAGDGKTLNVRIDTDYSINKESVLFGVIDSCDVKSSETIKAEQLKPFAMFAGHPFAVRFRVEDDALTFKDFKGLGVGSGEKEPDMIAGALALLNGRFTKVDPSKPLPPLKAANKAEYNSDPLIRQDQLLNQSERLGGLSLPSPHYLKHYPTYFAPDSTGELKQAKAEEPAADTADCDPPSDAEVMRAFNAMRLRDVGKDYEKRQDDITIVKSLISSRVDGPRYYPLVGFARTHHCLWECTVSFRDPTILKAKTEVVCLDVDRLRACWPTPEVVPQRMPEK